MATNLVRKPADTLRVNVSAVNGSGTGDLVKSGDPGMVGSLAFVALTDEAADGTATVDVSESTYELSVRGFDGTAGVAVAVGDLISWNNTAGELRKEAITATNQFGIALGAVASGATTAVEVKIRGA